MEAALIAGFHLAIAGVAAGVILGVFSVIFYSALWFFRDR